MKMKNDEMILTIRVKVQVDWWSAIKMRLMGRYPAAILARALAEKLRAAT